MIRVNARKDRILRHIRHTGIEKDAEWSEPQSLDKNLFKLLGNEFGIALGSFLLV